MYEYDTEILKTGAFTIKDVQYKFELIKCNHNNSLVLESTYMPRFGKQSQWAYYNIFEARQKGNDTLEIDYYTRDHRTFNLIKSNLPLRIKTPSSSNGIESTESGEITEWVNFIKQYPFTQEMLDWDKISMTDLNILILKTGFFTLENDDIKSKFELRKDINTKLLFLVSTSDPRFREPSVVKYNNIFDARKDGNDTLEIDYYTRDPETSNLRIKTPSSSNGIKPTESTEITEWVDLIKKYPSPQELLSRDNTSITDSKK
jgi:hypothetical protein